MATKNATTQLFPRGVGYSKYKLPTPDVLPVGVYFSTIVDARHTTTESGERAVEVLYKMRYSGYIWKNPIHMNTNIIHLGLYYIKELYLENSPQYSNLANSMLDAFSLGFPLGDIKGITECVEIYYLENGNVGGIDKRYPMSWKEFLKVIREIPYISINDDYIPDDKE